MIKTLWPIVRFLGELAYDIAREALRPQPIPRGVPLRLVDVEIQRKASNQAGHEPPTQRCPQRWN